MSLYLSQLTLKNIPNIIVQLSGGQVPRFSELLKTLVLDQCMVPVFGNNVINGQVRLERLVIINSGVRWMF